MIRPGAWLGLPPGVPNPLYDLGLWRDLLILTAAAAAWRLARGRTAPSIALSIAFALLSVGFWILAFGRPYGVLVDPEVTRWAADVSVLARAGGTHAFLVGEPGPRAPWSVLAALGTPAELLLLSGTLAPLLLLAGLAAVIALLGPREMPAVAVALWVGAATGGLDALRGVGLLDGAWRRPWAACVLVATATLVLALGRLGRGRAALLAGTALVAGGAVLGQDDLGLGLGSGLLLVTFDQWPWVIPAAVGVSRSGPGEKALLLGGAVCVFASALAGSGAWIGHGAFRLGLVLAAARGLVVLAEAFAPSRVAPKTVVAVAVFAAMAGGFPVWWDPFRMDDVARASAGPVAPGQEDAMAWVRAHTAPEGTFVASSHYAPAVAVLGGRRVLRAPGLAEAPDEERRLRTEKAVVSGRPVPDLVSRYALRYVFAAPGDFDEHGLVDPIELEGRGGLRLLYVNDSGLRVYELPQTGPPPALK